MKTQHVGTPAKVNNKNRKYILKAGFFLSHVLTDRWKFARRGAPHDPMGP